MRALTDFLATLGLPWSKARRRAPTASIDCSKPFVAAARRDDQRGRLRTQMQANYSTRTSVTSASTSPYTHFTRDPALRRFIIIAR